TAAHRRGGPRQGARPVRHGARRGRGRPRPRRHRQASMCRGHRRTARRRPPGGAPVTATDEILALAASVVDPPSASVASLNTDAVAPAIGRTTDWATAVTEADFAAFSEAAARGADSAVVRALLAIQRGVEPWPPPPAAPLGDPAWNAWL